jgi:hypothetical protein
MTTMKKVLFVLLLVALALGGYAKKNKTADPICGAWKYYNGSVINDFQRITKQNASNTFASEYFVFNKNNEFKHEFLNNENQIVKTLIGKWKAEDGKIKISYADIDFQLSINYFFIDKDLVLGQNFNHVVLTKDISEGYNDDNANLASIGK